MGHATIFYLTFRNVKKTTVDDDQNNTSSVHNTDYILISNTSTWLSTFLEQVITIPLWNTNVVAVGEVVYLSFVPLVDHVVW
jgi:hypothetical protein